MNNFATSLETFLFGYKFSSIRTLLRIKLSKNITGQNFWYSISQLVMGIKITNKKDRILAALDYFQQSHLSIVYSQGVWWPFICCMCYSCYYISEPRSWKFQAKVDLFSFYKTKSNIWSKLYSMCTEKKKIDFLTLYLIIWDL